MKQYTSEVVDAPLAIQIYPGADASFTMYEGDGATFASEREDWMSIDMLWDDRQRRLMLQLTGGSRMRAPASRRMQVRVAGSRAVREIVFTGKPIAVRV